MRARSKYQFSSSRLLMEDYKKQNYWDYTQKNHDRTVLENPQIDTLDPNFKKTTIKTQKLNTYLS